MDSSYCRAKSPEPGRSILITRAPRSASCRVASGAATACSRVTTVMPDSASTALPSLYVLYNIGASSECTGAALLGSCPARVGRNIPSAHPMEAGDLEMDENGMALPLGSPVGATADRELGRPLPGGLHRRRRLPAPAGTHGDGGRRRLPPSCGGPGG